jgi:hypothetical protein
LRCAIRARLRRFLWPMHVNRFFSSVPRINLSAATVSYRMVPIDGSAIPALRSDCAHAHERGSRWVLACWPRSGCSGSRCCSGGSRSRIACCRAAAWLPRLRCTGAVPAGPRRLVTRAQLKIHDCVSARQDGGGGDGRARPCEIAPGQCRRGDEASFPLSPADVGAQVLHEHRRESCSPWIPVSAGMSVRGST